ncbi:MAG TPA: hypothetical protein VFD49_25320 [Candidatus Dormibacteraeota bacterium]|nr:hypothetical protein [Candidatus Dormibacteraeota bacterium]
MVGEDRHCIDVLTQASAVKARARRRRAPASPRPSLSLRGGGDPGWRRTEGPRAERDHRTSRQEVAPR